MKFPEPELQELRYDLDSTHPGLFQDIADGIDKLTMARYRLSAYRKDVEDESASEEALAGLMQSLLLKRFESSWYAALQTVNRMRTANEILVRLVSELEVVPPPEVVRELVGDAMEDDSFLDAELIDSAIAAAEGGIPADRFRDDFLPALEKDLETLGNLTDSLKALEGLPDPKLQALQDMLSSTAARKMAIFISFQDTALYLRERIENRPEIPGGRSWTVVIGAETSADARMRELERFCPESVTGDSGFVPDDGEVDVLLSTDILSEGQNLQQAQTVLSYDMPWNPQRVVQRNGRVVRLHSPHETVYLYTLLPEPGDLDRLLRLEAKLAGQACRPRSWRPTARWAWRPPCWPAWRPSPRCRPI